MTEPPFGATGGPHPFPPPVDPPVSPPYYPPPDVGQAGQQPWGQQPWGPQSPAAGMPYPPASYPAGYYPDPTAPYGRDPFTGEPLSDKSKVIAGLLQLLGLLGVLGIGRIYLGQTTFGVAQLVGCLLLSVVTCGIGVVVPIIWGIVDAVLIFTGRVRDEYGRPLRDGT